MTYTASQLVEPFLTIVQAGPSTGCADRTENTPLNATHRQANLTTSVILLSFSSNIHLLRKEQKSAPLAEKFRWRFFWEPG